MTCYIQERLSSVSTAFWQAAADADHRLIIDYEPPPAPPINDRISPEVTQITTDWYSPPIFESTLAYCHTNPAKAIVVTALALIAITCACGALATLTGVVTFTAGIIYPSLMFAGVAAIAVLCIELLSRRDMTITYKYSYGEPLPDVIVRLGRFLVGV